jgi:uncharacterized protein with ParB-like and HNH nuclease domain
MKSQPLYKFLDDLNRSVYLPHIQRPFVWGEEQVKKLLDSLLRGYPIPDLLTYPHQFLSAFPPSGPSATP